MGQRQAIKFFIKWWKLPLEFAIYIIQYQKCMSWNVSSSCKHDLQHWNECWGEDDSMLRFATYWRRFSLLLSALSVSKSRVKVDKIFFSQWWPSSASDNIIMWICWKSFHAIFCRWVQLTWLIFIDYLEQLRNSQHFFFKQNSAKCYNLFVA